MGASLYIGKNLHFVQPGDDGGTWGLEGDPLDCENMPWSSIRELEEVAERYLGIPPGDWPFYPDVELEEEFPLEDVLQKCAKLRARLSGIPIEDLPDNRRLRSFAWFLGEGFDFCAKAW